MAGQPQKTLFGHPVGLYVLFSSELWERFSFYGMRGLLVLYMTKALMYDKDFAYGTYGAYIGFVYATPFIGGMLADRFLGYRRAILLGGSLMFLGHIAMAVEQRWFFYGAMALLVAGNGFFKPNISALVGKLYEREDPRRDSAFTIFYMGINLGAGLAPLLCGAIGELYGWHWGFSLAAVGMAIGLTVFWFGGRYLGPHGYPPRPEAFRETVVSIPKTVLLGLGIAAFLPATTFLFTQPDWVEIGVYIIGPIFLAYILFKAFTCPARDRDRLIVAIVLALFSIVFWACFEQAGSSMTIFADEQVNRVIFGWEIPASTLLAINPWFIVLLGIPFSILWAYLGKRDRDPSAPFKFALGLVQLAIGFVMLVIAAEQAKHGKAPLAWLILAYFFHTTGELCTSPVGLSAMTRLAPEHLTGLMMGFWFFCAAFAGVFSGVIAKFTTGEGDVGSVFLTLVWVGLAGGALMAMLTPLLKRLQHEGE
ncbi:MAG TPA: peptide MFS transporter [Phycisphaerae bacterium]|nr:peptide MFS transporter [Phycisphaerae bacterium]